MTKVTATIELNGESKTVTVALDDTTYALLQQTGDQELFNHYIAEEYKASLIERKETRRHQSLEHFIESGMDIEDTRPGPFELAVYSEDTRILKAAMKTLTERQRIIVWRVAVKGEGFREISRSLGLNKDTVREHYLDGIKKLQLFFQKHPAKV